MNYRARMFARGKRALARHNAHTALRCFEGALNSCPISERAELSRVLFYLGVTLLKLGRRNGAVRAFTDGAKVLKRRSVSLGMLRRMSNEYGMARQPSGMLDDWAAFYALQLKRYLASRRIVVGVDAVERDMIFDVIATRWKAILASGALSGRSAAEKLSIFRTTEVAFPVMMGAPCGGGDVIPVDFRGKRKVSLGDRCACGSGLPFMSCCGRTYGVEELRPGAF